MSLSSPGPQTGDPSLPPVETPCRPSVLHLFKA